MTLPLGQSKISQRESSSMDVTVSNAVPVDSSNVGQLRAWDGDEGEYWADQRRVLRPVSRRLPRTATRGGRDQRTSSRARRRLRHRSDHPRRGPRGLGWLRTRGRPVVTHARPRPPPRHRGGRDQRDVRAGRRADPPVRARLLRRCHQPHRRDVLRRPRRRVQQHRPRPALGRTAGARDLAAAARQRVDPRDLRGACSGTRPASRPPPDAPGPFALSDRDRVRALLTSAGFVDVELDGTTAGMWFGNDADDAHRFVLGLMGWMLEGLDDAGRARAIGALHATMAAHETPDGVLFESAAWIIQATLP